MIGKVFAAFVSLSTLFAVSTFVYADDVVIPGDLHITGSGNGLIFPDGSTQISAPVNPFSSFVKTSCNYTQLSQSGAYCYCPTAPVGYKAIAIQGGIVCGKGDNSFPAVESFGAQDNWVGGHCEYLYFTGGTLSGRTEDVPQQIMVSCVNVPQ